MKLYLTKVSLLLLVMLLNGCARFSVTSNPEGARVYLNGVDTGQITPARIDLGDLPKGSNVISVQHDGFEEAFGEEIIVTTSKKAVFWTILPVSTIPSAIAQFSCNYWKTSDANRRLKFKLEKEVVYASEEVNKAKAELKKAKQRMAETKRQYGSGELGKEEYKLFIKEDEEAVEAANTKYEESKLKNKPKEQK